MPKAALLNQVYISAKTFHLTVFLASQEKFDGSAPTVHCLVRPKLLPRSPGNTSFIDRRAEVSATNREWNNCFSVQVRGSTLI